MNRRIFRAMGCDVIIVGGEPQAFEKIAKLFEERDATFSRFRSDSELNASTRPAARRLWCHPSSPRRGLRRARRGEHDPRARSTRPSARDRRRRLRPRLRRPRPHPTAVERRHAPTGGRSLRRRRTLPPARNGARSERRRQVDRRSTPRLPCSARPGFVAAGGDLATHRSPVTWRCRAAGRSRLVSGGIATSGTATRRWLRGGPCTTT